MSALIGRLRRGLPTSVLLLVLGVLVIVPMLFIALAAFSSEIPRPGSIGLSGLSFDNFAIFGSSQALGAVGNSLLIAGSASVLALAIGCGLAFLAARTDAPGRRFIYFAGIAPMFLPSLVGALAWSLLGSPATGFLNLLLHGAGDEQIPLSLAERCFAAAGSKQKTLKVFSREEGGFHHCQVDDVTIGVHFMWDWLADVLKPGT